MYCSPPSICDGRSCSFITRVFEEAFINEVGSYDPLARDPVAVAVLVPLWAPRPLLPPGTPVIILYYLKAF